MLKNLTEDKRLDLDAPLLSVRRFSTAAAAADSESTTKLKELGKNPASKRSSLPFYKSDLKSGPVRDPGVVPFVWEQSPGQPKDGPRLDRPVVAPKLPPCRISIEKESIEPKIGKISETEKNSVEINEENDDQEEDDYADALDTLSRTESFFMNCSLVDAEEPFRSFSADPQVRDFMMGRFLPAAKAMAMGSPDSSLRKPAAQFREATTMFAGRAEIGDRRFEHNSVAQFRVDKGGVCDEEDCYEDNEHLSSKACGLLPKLCTKSSLCLLNPVPGMKVSNRRFPQPTGRSLGISQARALHLGSLAQTDAERSWEAVYRHKLGHGNPPSGENRSKLTCSSDSQTADGSPSYRGYYCSGISPYRNEPLLSPFDEGKGFLGVPKREGKNSKTDGSDTFEKDGENYWVLKSEHSSQQGSGSISPAIERTLYMDSGCMSETPRSIKSSSVDTTMDAHQITESADEDSEVGVEGERAEEFLARETPDRDAWQLKASESLESDLPVCSEILACEGTDGYRQNDSNGCLLPLKEEYSLKNRQSLVPPPLPKSPSDSWLCRTLPSMSLKSSSTVSFLSNRSQPREQVIGASLAASKQETMVKPFKMQRGQTRFADMLAKPLSPQSEI